jgi:anti-sigma B factor antagonist
MTSEWQPRPGNSSLTQLLRYDSFTNLKQLEEDATMDIKERVVEGVSVLDISGKIVLGEGDLQIKDRIKDLLSDGQRRILLNLGDVSYIDSAGLGALISGYTTVKREGGQLKLVNLTKRIKDLLAITKLITVFDTYENEKEATDSYTASQ